MTAKEWSSIRSAVWGLVLAAVILNAAYTAAPMIEALVRKFDKTWLNSFTSIVALPFWAFAAAWHFWVKRP